MAIESRLLYVVAICLALHVLMVADATKYVADESYSEDDDNGKRKSNEFEPWIGDYRETGYLCSAIADLTTEVSSIRKIVMEVRDGLTAAVLNYNRMATNGIRSAVPDDVNIRRPKNIFKSFGELFSGRFGPPRFPVSPDEIVNTDSLGLSLRDDIIHYLEGHLHHQAANEVEQVLGLQNQGHTAYGLWPEDEAFRREMPPSNIPGPFIY